MAHIISRQEAEALIQEQVSATIMQDVPKESIFMQLARRLPNMTSKQTRIPVLDMLPMSYWVSGDTGYKQTSEQAWANVFLNAEELAVIVPIPEAVLDDADFDIMGEVTPRVKEAIGMRVDQATLFGVNRPQGWRLDILSTALQAGNNVASTGGDYYDLIMGEGGVIGKVEESGHMVTGFVSGMSMRAKLRGLRAEGGTPIFNSNMQGATPYALDGSPIYFPQNGSFDNSRALMIAGDFSQAVYAIRQDITVKILDQGVIQDPNTKEIIYNLAQQDMIALRVVFRMGWALPNPATRMNSDRVLVPFAYLEPAASSVVTNAVNITVNDGDSAIEGARVDVEGARRVTNASGVASFALENGTYNVKVTAKGYTGAKTVITVSGGSVSETVSLSANA